MSGRNPLARQRIPDLSTGHGLDVAGGRPAGAREGVDIAGTSSTPRGPPRKRKGCRSNTAGDAESLPFDDGARRRVHVRRDAEPPRGRGRGARPCLPEGRADRPDHLGVGRKGGRYILPRRAPLRGRRSNWGRTGRIGELLGSSFEVRFEKGVSYYREPSATPPGIPSRGATARPACWPAASTRTGARPCARSSSPFTRASPRSSASACRASIGSPWARGSETPPPRGALLRMLCWSFFGGTSDTGTA